MRANFVMSGVATGMRRNLTMTIALVLSTAIALAFVGAAILADREISNFKHDYENKLNVSLYLCPGKSGSCKGQITPAQQSALETELKNDPMVRSVSYISQQEAYARFRKVAAPDVAQLT